MIASHSLDPHSLDIVHVTTPVEVEFDRRRGVLYVHCEGHTVLRIKTGREPIIITEHTE